MVKQKFKLPGATLSDDDVAILRKMADRFRKETTPAEDTGAPSMDQTPDTYIAKIPAGGIPALIDGAEPQPGSAECDIYRIYDDAGTKKLYPISNLAKTVYNLATTALALGYALVTRTKGGQWIAMSGGGGGEYYKHLGRFTFDSALTISSEQVWGTRTDEYGEGVSHEGHDTDAETGTGTAGTHVILHNFLTHAEGVYEFYADAGDACLAYYDHWESADGTGTASGGSGTEHWIIVIPECP
jgi:hypothetical protein